MATRRCHRPVLFLIVLAGCGSPIAETGPDDPLPLPPVLVAVPEILPGAAAPAEPEQNAPAVDVVQAPAGPAEHSAPADVSGRSPRDVTAALLHPDGGSAPADIPRIRLQNSGRRQPAAEPSSPIVPAGVATGMPADDHYHRDFSVPGDNVVFQQAAGSGQIWLSLDRETFSRLTSALSRGDGKSYRAIVETGNVRFVAPSTPGVVLTVEPKSRRVRVTGGSLAGLEGWIDEDHLRAAPAPMLTAQAKAERERELSRQKGVKAAKDQAKMKATMDFFGVKPPNRPR